MRRVEVICYPRSGYRLSKRIIREYFGNEFHNASIYVNPNNNMDTNPKITFQKNHDLNLQTKIREDRDYLILIRYPLECLTSYYELQVSGFGQEHSKEAWKNFAIQKLDYWKRFYEKWVVTPISSRHVLNYGMLMDDPCGELSRVVSYLDLTGKEVDKNRIKKIIDKFDVRRKSDFRDFEFYEEEFFDKLRRKVKTIQGIDIDRDILEV